MLWRTRTALRTERNLASYDLPKADSEYPIDYVLDGQQRITSIFGIFQNSLPTQNNQENHWTNLFFELDSEDDIPFKYLDDPNNYNPEQFFPLKYVFDSRKYRQMTRDLDERLATQIDDLVDRFTKSRIPIERFETEDKRNVATVFERVNRRKIDLDIFDLLSVWNWSEDFSLKEKFQDMSNKLDEFGFKGISDDLLLKCSSAVIMDTCKSEAFLDIPGNELSEKCSEIETGLDKAIDFLKSEFNIFSLKLLPMENILVVLTSFFASQKKQPSPVPENQMKVIKEWFWRSCFTERYAKGSTKSTDWDLNELCKLKKGEENKRFYRTYCVKLIKAFDSNQAIAK